MIVTRYSPATLNAVETLRYINNVTKNSMWKRKFAWQKQKLEVPGSRDNPSTEYFVWLGFYYSRTVYNIRNVTTNEVELTKMGTLNIKSLDLITYFSVENNFVIDEERKRAKDIMLRTKQPVLTCNFYGGKREKFFDLYSVMYENIYNTKFAKEFPTPDEYRETVEIGEY